MELGARFLSYKGCLYGLWSCVPVRSHNRQHGTAVRQDVRFIWVKFGCAQLQKYRERKENHPSLCPAYFVLQYKEDIVISEVNNHSAHTCTGIPLDSTVTKLQIRDTRSGTMANKDSHMVVGHQWMVCPAPSTAPTLPEAPEESASASVLIRVVEVMKPSL